MEKRTKRERERAKMCVYTRAEDGGGREDGNGHKAAVCIRELAAAVAIRTRGRIDTSNRASERA